MNEQEPEPLRVRSLPPRPLLIWDGDCNFCRRWIARWQHMTGDAVDYEPSQMVGNRYPEIEPERFKRAVQLVEPTGEVYSGAHAVLRVLAKSPHRKWPLWLYEHVPGVPAVTEAAYNLVARHRRGFSKADDVLSAFLRRIRRGRP